MYDYHLVAKEMELNHSNAILVPAFHLLPANLYTEAKRGSNAGQETLVVCCSCGVGIPLASDVDSFQLVHISEVVYRD